MTTRPTKPKPTNKKRAKSRWGKFQTHEPNDWCDCRYCTKARGKTRFFAKPSEAEVEDLAVVLYMNHSIFFPSRTAGWKDLHSKTRGIWLNVASAAFAHIRGGGR